MIQDLKSILANDRSPYLPREPALVFEPPDSWSGARFLRWKSLTGEMLLKVWPQDGPNQETHAWRHHNLQGLKDFRPECSLPIEDLQGRTLRTLPDGRMAELFPWLEGEQVGLIPAAETVDEVITTLARLHTFRNQNDLRKTGISGSVKHRLGRLIALESGGYSELLRSRKGQSDSGTTVTAEISRSLASILEMARRLTPFAIRSLESVVSREMPLQIVLRDVRPNHFLCRDGHVIGLFDFGAIGLDTVALDLSRLLGEWYRLDRATKDLALGTYESFRPLGPAEIAAVEPLILANAILGGIAWFDIHDRRRLTQGREAAAIRALKHAEDRLRHQCERHSLRT